MRSAGSSYPTGSCLDVGCGGGHLLHVPRELGWKLVGVNLSPACCVLRGCHPDVELVHSGASALPFEDAMFDAAFSTFIDGYEYPKIALAIAETADV